MHTIASRVLAPRTPEISSESRRGVVAFPRRLPGGGDVKTVLHHAGNHVPNGLGKHDHSPTGRAQHMGKIRECE